MRAYPTAVLLLLTGVLAACGEDPAGYEATLAPQPLVGVYALDVTKTTAGRIKDIDGHDVSVAPEVLEKVQAGHLPEAFRLTMGDGTFELFLENGAVDWTSTGTWVEAEAGVELTTTMIDGKPAPEEMALTESYRREDGYLISVPQEGMAAVYLKRQPDRS